MAAIGLALGPAQDPTPFISETAAGHRLELAVTGARCAGCIKKIEGDLARLPGVASTRMNLSTGKLVVEWSGAKSLGQSVIGRLAALGFPAKAFDPASVRNAEDQEASFLLSCLAVAGFAAGNVMLFSVSIWAGADMDDATRTLFHWLSALIAIPAVAYSGRPFFRSAFAALSRGRTNMDVPVTLGVSLALLMSMVETAFGAQHAYFDASVTLLFFLLIGRYLDHRLRAAARSAANDLLSMQSASATVIASGGRVHTVAAKDIEAGARLLVAPGERLIADGVLEAPESEWDLALLTGESDPVRREAGASVKAGALNVGSTVTVRVTAGVANSYVADLARLLEAAEQNRSQFVRIADRAARAYVPIVHGLALAAFVWALAMGFTTHDAVMRAVTLLIITCPCALALAVPAVQIVAAGRLFRQGLLMKSGDALERLALVDVAVFDKTGTLTVGRPQLLNSKEIPESVLESAASLARASRHPLARAVVGAAGEGPVAGGVREAAGLGLEAIVDGESWRLGNARFVGAAEAGAAVATLYFRQGQDAPVRFEFADTLRPDAVPALEALRVLGLTVEMMSGDRRDAVAAAADAAGIGAWSAETLPEEKTERIVGLKSAGHRVLMLGDGLNDAAALASATASISPGSGADVAQAAADFVLQGQRLAPVVDAVRVARAARARIFENLAFSVLYNACAVPLAFAGLVTPLVAAIAMSGSSLIVTLNALRLAQFRKV